MSGDFPDPILPDIQKRLSFDLSQSTKFDGEASAPVAVDGPNIHENGFSCAERRVMCRYSISSYWRTFRIGCSAEYYKLFLVESQGMVNDSLTASSWSFFA
jgi:hypothetical protein